MTPLRQRMLEDLQIRRYSPTTIRIYLRCIAEFARHIGKPPDRLSAEHIREYQLFLIQEKRVAYVLDGHPPLGSEVIAGPPRKRRSNGSPYSTV